MRIRTRSRKCQSFLIAGLLVLSLTSCYSVRFISRDGVPEPDLSNESRDFYKNKKVFVVDTTINLKLSEGSFNLIRNCGPTGFYAFEYRVSLGHVLLSGITLGRVRKVKVKYVRLKEEN
jgi:hypothetical protein